METAISVFGATGFVGKSFVQQTHHKCICVPREHRVPPTDNILYLISTTDNYNVFSDLHKDIDTNLNVLMETLQHCKKTGLVFNFVSSWFVYGSHRQLPVPETAYCDPKGFYSITKRTAEQLLMSWCNTFDVNYRILRLSNIYGPGDAGASTKKNAIQHMVTQLYHDKPIQLYEGGLVSRDLLYISDAVRAISLVLEKGELNSVYNIGYGKPTLLRDVIDIATLLTNSRSHVSNIPTPDFHKKIQSRDFWLDTTKLQKLGFAPQVCLTEGLTSLINSIALHS